MIDFISLLAIGTIVCFVLTIVGYCIDKKSKSRCSSWEGLYIIGSMACAILLVVTIVTAAYLYTNAISLPQEYRAACDTVDETKELLMQFNQTNIGYGLEALELKQTLSSAIKDKNNLAANIRAWLINPLMPYRDLLREGLSADFS